MLWRALIRSLGAQDHRVVFFERDVPYYAEHRDLTEIDGGRLVLYRDWRELAAEARQQLADADAAVVTSYCPDALAASALVFDSRALRVFYDLDSPVTLARLAAGAQRFSYLGTYAADVLAALDLSDRELAAIGAAARERALSEHTAERRAAELARLVEAAAARAPGNPTNMPGAPRTATRLPGI